jgi:hypothetical protein
MRAANIAVAALAFAVLLEPGVSEACAVCFSGTDENRVAFLVTTGLLTFMPLLIVGSTVTWLWRRARRLELERERRATGLPPVTDIAA